MKRALIAIVVIGCGSKDKPKEAPKESPSRRPVPVDAAPAIDATPKPLTPVPAHVDPPREDGPARPTQLAVGYNHACARMSDDTMRCWGGNDWGQLGDGTLLVATKKTTPALTDVVQVSAGYGFTCARRRDHTVWCFGNALDGEIGVPSPTDPAVNHSIPVPTQVPDLTDAVDISSAFHSCAARADGTVWCWGRGRKGKVAGVDGVTQITAGYATCARRVDATAWCWDADQGDTPKPLAVKDVVEVRAGIGFACARDGAGALWCWGANDSGQLGRTTDDVSSDVPAPVQGLTGAGAFAASDTHGCAIVGKDLLCWGEGWINPSFPEDCMTMTQHSGGGEGGSPAQWEFCAKPTVVKGVLEPTDVGTLSRMACAIANDDRVVCWGADDPWPTTIGLSDQP